MMPEIKKVEPRPGHRLLVQFRNGESRLFDMTPYLDKGIFDELKNERYFKKVRVIWGGIEWPHEQDISADTLYYQGLRIQKRNGSARLPGAANPAA